MLKNSFCAIIGAIGAAIASFFGGWDAALVTLLVCMGIDYITGLIVAGIFHASPKSQTGGLESYAGWKGLIRKAVTLLVVIVAQLLDRSIGTNYIRDAVVIAFTVNEVLSVVENAGLMGIPIPKVLVKAIDALKNKEGDE